MTEEKKYNIKKEIDAQLLPEGSRERLLASIYAKAAQQSEAGEERAAGFVHKGQRKNHAYRWVAAAACIVALVLAVKFFPGNTTASNNSANSVPGGVLATPIPGIWDSAYVIATVRPTDVENAEEYNSIIDTCFVFKGEPYEQKYEGIVCRIEYIFNYERFEEHMLENHTFREGEPYPIEDFDGLSMIYFPEDSVSEIEPDTVIMFKLEIVFVEEDPAKEDPSKKTYYDQAKKSMGLSLETGISYIRFGEKGLELTYNAIWSGATYEPIRFYNDYVSSGRKLQEGATVQEAIEYFKAIDRSGYLRRLEEQYWELRKKNEGYINY